MLSSRAGGVFRGERGAEGRRATTRVEVGISTEHGRNTGGLSLTEQASVAQAMIQAPVAVARHISQ